MKKSVGFYGLFLFFFLQFPLLHGQICTYSGANDGAMASTDPNLTGTGLVRVNGAISSIFCSSSSGFYSELLSTSSTFNTSLTAVEFSATPKPGYKITITSWKAKISRSSFGNLKALLAYSIDGGSTWVLGSAITLPSANCGAGTNFTLDVTDFTSFSTVKFRIYAYNSSGSRLQIISAHVYGTVPLLADNDGDGFFETNDCDENNAAINPGANEECNAIDDDCDGIADNGLYLIWQKSLGGTSDDWGQSFQATSDGGVIAAVLSYSIDGDISSNKGDSDYWIVKLDPSGNIEWEKSYGGTSGDDPRSIDQTTDGGYVVAGASNSTDGDVTGNHGSSDYWIVKLDAIGNIEWENSYGGTESDVATSIKQTIDGGYVVAGETSSHDGQVGSYSGNNVWWVIKLDNAGNVTWENPIAYHTYEFSPDIIQTIDGGYAIAGYVNFTFDCGVVKLNNEGNPEWEIELGGSGDDFATSIQQTTDAGFIIAGGTYSTDGDVTENHGLDDIWIVKLNESGSIVWQKTLGGTDTDYGSSICQTEDGGYLVGGTSQSNDGDLIENQGSNDMWLFKLNASGDIQWQKSIGGSNSDAAIAFQQLSDGGYVAAGTTWSSNGDVTGNHGGPDLWVVKFSEFPLTIFADADGDGFGDTSTGTIGCPSTGFILNNTDCNDLVPSINPGAEEICNSIDDNCNGLTDENVVTALITALGPITFCKDGSVTLQVGTGNNYSFQWLKNGANINNATSVNYSATKTGSYQVRVTVPGGCYAVSSPVGVTVLTNPNATISTPNGLDLCNNTVKLTANGGTGLTYAWYKNGVLQVGVTSKTYKPSVAGTYQLKVTDANGCSKLSSTVTVIKSCKLEGVNFSNPELSLYPNPNNGEFTIELHVEIADGPVVISVYDQLGRLIMEKNTIIAHGYLKETLQGELFLTAGIFAVIVRSENRSWEQLLVVQR